MLALHRRMNDPSCQSAGFPCKMAKRRSTLSGKSDNLHSDDPVRALAKELQTALSEARASLDAAEKALDHVPALSSMADKARKAKDEGLSQAHEADAQGIRDQRRDALLSLDAVRRDLVRTLRPLAVEHPVVRGVLEQMERISPYSSVRVADELLALLDVLVRSAEPREAKDVDPDSGPPLFAAARPTEEERKRLAALLPQAIAERGHNFRWAAHKMGISENTLKSLRAGRAVQPETWRKAVRFLQAPKR